jgi:hypothetical protein
VAILSRDELRNLVNQPREIGISIYMPAHRTGDVKQDPIRLKNLLREGEKQLADNGLRPKDARQLLEPAERRSGNFLVTGDFSQFSSSL